MKINVDNGPHFVCVGVDATLRTIVFCKFLGIHRWIPFIMSRQWFDCFPERWGQIERRCIDCGCMQSTMDGLNWHARV